MQFGPIRRDCPGQRLLFGEEDPLVVRGVGTCARCGRRLVMARSVESGYGPVCRKVLQIGPGDDQEWFAELWERAAKRLQEDVSE